MKYLAYDFYDFPWAKCQTKLVAHLFCLTKRVNTVQHHLFQIRKKLISNVLNGFPTKLSSDDKCVTIWQTRMGVVVLQAEWFEIDILNLSQCRCCDNRQCRIACRVARMD